MMPKQVEKKVLYIEKYGLKNITCINGCQAALEDTCQEKKREELGLKYKKMYWIVGRRSALSIHNKLLLYK